MFKLLKLISALASALSRRGLGIGFVRSSRRARRRRRASGDGRRATRRQHALVCVQFRAKQATRDPMSRWLEIRPLQPRRGTQVKRAASTARRAHRALPLLWRKACAQLKNRVCMPNSTFLIGPRGDQRVFGAVLARLLSAARACIAPQSHRAPLAHARILPPLCAAPISKRSSCRPPLVCYAARSRKLSLLAVFVPSRARCSKL